MDQFISFKSVLFKLKNCYRLSEQSAHHVQGKAAMLDLLAGPCRPSAVPGWAGAAGSLVALWQSRDATPAPSPRSLCVELPCFVPKSNSVVHFILNSNPKSRKQFKYTHTSRTAFRPQSPATLIGRCYLTLLIRQCH